MNTSFFSLNVCGIRDFKKRKKIFRYLLDHNNDIFFLQETHSTKDVEMFWKWQLRGHLYFSHGTQHGQGVLIFIKENVEFNVINEVADKNGRYFLLKAEISGKKLCSG